MVITSTVVLGGATAATALSSGALFAHQNKKIKRLQATQTKAEIKILGLGGAAALLLGAQISDEVSRGKQIKLIGDRLTAVESAVNAINSRPPAYVIQPSVPATPMTK